MVHLIEIFQAHNYLNKSSRAAGQVRFLSTDADRIQTGGLRVQEATRESRICRRGSRLLQQDFHAAEEGELYGAGIADQVLQNFEFIKTLNTFFWKPCFST